MVRNGRILFQLCPIRISLPQSRNETKSKFRIYFRSPESPWYISKLNEISTVFKHKTFYSKMVILKKNWMCLYLLLNNFLSEHFLMQKYNIEMDWENGLLSSALKAFFLYKSLYTFLNYILLRLRWWRHSVICCPLRNSYFFKKWERK